MDATLTPCPERREVVVRVRGELDLHTAPVLHHALLEACSSADHVVVDLAEVTFMDCAALHSVVAARRRLRSRGGELVVRSAAGRCLRLLAVTGLLELLEPAGSSDAVGA